MSNNTTKSSPGQLSLATVGKKRNRSTVLNNAPEVKECDTMDADGSTFVWAIQIFLN